MGKYDFNGSLECNIGFVGLRSQFRNHHGRIIVVAFSFMKRKLNNPIKLESLIMQVAMALILDFKKIIFKGDSKVIIDHLNGNTYYPSWVTTSEKSWMNGWSIIVCYPPSSLGVTREIMSRGPQAANMESQEPDDQLSPHWVSRAPPLHHASPLIVGSITASTALAWPQRIACLASWGNKSSLMVSVT